MPTSDYRRRLYLYRLSTAGKWRLDDYASADHWTCSADAAKKLLLEGGPNERPYITFWEADWGLDPSRADILRAQIRGGAEEVSVELAVGSGAHQKLVIDLRP